MDFPKKASMKAWIGRLSKAIKNSVGSAEFLSLCCLLITSNARETGLNRPGLTGVQNTSRSNLTLFSRF